MENPPAHQEKQNESGESNEVSQPKPTKNLDFGDSNEIVNYSIEFKKKSYPKKEIIYRQLGDVNMIVTVRVNRDFKI